MKGRKVLVVDDEQPILNLLTEVISRVGCEVLQARDGEEALRLFEAERPPLLITDLVMPKMDGLALVKAIKGADPRTEVLIITGHADLDSAIEAVRQGAFDYIVKPFSVETLRRRVNQALERHQLLTEREAWLAAVEERVQARTAALAESQRRLRALFNAISDPLVIVDESFTIVAANKRAVALGGTPLEGLTGRPYYRELCGREEICDGCPVPETFATGREVSAPITRRNPDGSFTYLEVSSYPLADGGQQPKEVVVLFRDITERVHQTRHLQNAERLAAIGQLGAGLAHELGNALAIVGGSVQFLLGYPGDRRQASREYLEVIHRNVAAADCVIRKLMDFARPREPVSTVMDVTEPLDRACFLLSGEFAKHGVEIVKHYEPDLPRIEGDPEQLQQVFLNLLLNAVQAMEGAGTITIRALFNPPKWVRLELMDTGQGIPQEYLRRIFDPFFTTREGGTGLGLSIAHRQVEAHRGKLTVESQEGKGTRFSILLPPMTPGKGPVRVG
jgi:PAS domain S-box-containing protein